ncbi:MAG: NAD-dependent epimerase/dehydratase family protein [Candidatus Heimdallarchaeota archaeon]
MTNFLITGGAGFIGHHLAKYLLGMEEKVTIFDCFSDYYSPYLKWKNARDVEKLGGTIVEGNILSKRELEKAISKNNIDTVIHLAAQPGVRYSTENPEMALRINVEGTSNVLSVSRENGVKKAVITSSSSVFGATQQMPMDENHPTNPISFYGVSKLTTEKLVAVCNHLYPEFDTSILRPFTVVGARQRPDMAINIFVSRILNRETITIFGDGNQTRDWTHVGNMVQAFYLAAIKPKAKHQIFNVGAGTRISVNQVLAIVAEVTGIDPILKYTEMNKADVKDTFADIGKAKRLLGYHPRKTISDAVVDFAQYWEDVNYGKLLASEKLIETEFGSTEIFSP